jgi:hypothetical protein
MWAKKTYMHNADLTNKDLWEFTHSLKNQSMYNYMLNDLINSNGFVRKELVVNEDASGQSYTSMIVFKDKETYDTYMNRDEISSIYEYIKIMAAQKGLEFIVSTVELDQS